MGDYRVIYLPGGRADATGDVRRYALEQGVTEEAAIERGLHEKAKEFRGTGTEIYAKR